MKEDLTKFYRSFLHITTFLINKNRLSAAEQSCSFMRAMQPLSLAAKILRRLEVTKPNVHPEDPYDLPDLYEAAQFAVASMPSTFPITAAPAVVQTPGAVVEIKPDPGISALVSTVSELIKVLASQKTATSSDGSTSIKRKRPDGCRYCSALDHFIGQCPRVTEDTQSGKCRRNVNGRVVLPSSAFVPRDIEGKDLHERIDNWHRKNLGQLAAAQLIVEVAHQQLTSAVAALSSSRNYVLSDDERLATLMAEVHAIRTRAAAKCALEAKDGQDEPEHTIPPTACAVPQPAAPHAAVPNPVPSQPPSHPFAGAHDAAYAPPKTRNIGAPAPKPTAYKNTLPIYSQQDAANIFKKILKGAVPDITTEELLSIAPEVCSYMREVTTYHCLPAKNTKPTDEPAAQLLHSTSDAAPFPDSYPALDAELQQQRSDEAVFAATLDSLPAAYAQAANGSQENLPDDAIIIPDPYAIFYSSGTVPDDLIVSLESSAIHSILPIIDNCQQIECIVDSGSQINAMSEAVCHELALLYDPHVILQMQSANGTVTPSLGLARNVPFRVGDITLCLQVHIVRNPAYDVLLGHPFEVLTQSVVRNFANEDQTITICDPNTGKLTTVPTVPRGPPCSRPQGFPNSRI
ncbi:hypothetical protein MVEN_00082300 [Mycena venus]|uniref:Peptidase A2 domain-containing protein n=1 Tax=Mycena venus TaxID=2733690 RepID=A0A8H6Z441_9AGAR|nr:hypothetical protein MVEN_00082300 [Mycena venus]